MFENQDVAGPLQHPALTLLRAYLLACFQDGHPGHERDQEK